jgi:hypothetical protein
MFFERAKSQLGTWCPSILQPFSNDDGWFDRFVEPIDDWNKSNIAVWVQRPRVFSIIVDDSRQEEIFRVCCRLQKIILSLCITIDKGVVEIQLIRDN